MASTFFGLDIAKSGLYNYQAALNTTAHNVANADTEGYSRQSVVQTASRPISISSRYGMQGTGVDIVDITQTRSEYYDTKYWDNNKLVGEYQTKEYYMLEIEGYFNELNTDGFTVAFNKFFTSLEELTKNPSSESTRVAVANYGKTFAEYINYMASCMDSVQSEANAEINNVVSRVNSIADQIAGLTREINSLEAAGRQRANDLRDSRANLVDELSKIANIKAEEMVRVGAEGVTEFRVTLDGQVLVDTYNVTTLKCVPREKKVNQSDIDGLFDLAWSNGVKVNMGSETLGGSLQALIEVRDGNNKGNLQGTGNGSQGDTELVVTASNINNIDDLNIPKSGTIRVGSKDYVYHDFRIDIAEDDEGNPEYTYTFELDKELVVDVNDINISVGKSINYKGVCYYQNKLNQFIRVFSRQFNELHKKGVDLNGDFGLDFFIPIDVKNDKDEDEDEEKDKVFAFDLTGTDYPQAEDDETINEIYSYEATYYALTASNIAVNPEIYNHVDKIVSASPDDEEKGLIYNGVENTDVLKLLYSLQTDRGMFKQGTPENFLETMIAEIGIDSKKARDLSESQEDIQATIQNQRLSIMSVDMEEEALNLVRFQNSYNLNSHVVNVMQQVYDRLINRTGA